MPTVATICAIFQPFLVVRGRPSQLFGFAKTPGLSLAPSQAYASGVSGLRSSDGRLLLQPPVCAFWTISKTQGVMSISTVARDPSGPSGHLPIASDGEEEHYDAQHERLAGALS